MRKKTLCTMALAVIFTAGAVVVNQAEARNCGVRRDNLIDNNPKGTLGGQIAQTAIRSGRGTNQAIIASRAISDQASPSGFDTNNLFLLRVTITAGGHSFWHYHPGVNYIMVQQGVLSYYTVNRDGSCKEHTISSNNGFVEVPGMIHAIENKSGTDVVAYASVLMSEELPHFTVDSDCSDNFCDPGLTEPTGANCPTGFGTSDSNGDACSGGGSCLSDPHEICGAVFSSQCSGCCFSNPVCGSSGGPPGNECGNATGMGCSNPEQNEACRLAIIDVGCADECNVCAP